MQHALASLRIVVLPVTASVFGLHGALAAQLDWSAVDVLTARERNTLTWDGAALRLIGSDLRGGIHSDLTESWSWTGSGWTAATDPSTAPARRTGHAACYDSRRGVIVIFGGLPNVGAETWEWDGATWARHAGLVAPPARVGAQMVFDPLRGQCVLFGGEDGARRFDDTWVYDGSSWQQRTSTSRPGSRTAHGMAWSPVDAGIVLFGGVDGSPTGTRAYGDMWVWNGTNWVERHPSRLPRPRSAHAMAFDGNRNVVVMFGGTDRFLAPLADTWEYDGTTWRRARPATTPDRGRWYHAMAWDRVGGGGVVLFGGEDEEDPGSLRSDAWVWNGTDWRRVAADAGVPPARATTWTWDPNRGELLRFGGRGGFTFFDETWSFDGSRWARLLTPTVPNGREGMSMVTDTARGRVVMFGGAQTFPLPDVHWEWDGNDWRSVSGPQFPLGRTFVSLAYDQRRARTVAFGGVPLNSQTWEFDGVVWRRITTANSPSARAGAATAYDARRGVVVVFGGGGGQFLGDTWEYDGVDWTLRAAGGAVGPNPRERASMVYDPSRERCVLFGGSGTGAPLPAGTFDDTWEWDGASWRLLPTPGRPGGRWQLALAYDPSDRSIVAHAGVSSRSTFGDADRADVWRLTPGARATTTRFGRGCAGSAGVPRIDVDGVPTLGNAFFGFVIADARANAAAAVGVGANAASIPLGGGCSLLVQPPTSDLGVTIDASGRGVARTPIPAVPALRGGIVVAQGFVIDPAGAFAGIAAVTDGVRLVLGD